MKYKIIKHVQRNGDQFFTITGYAFWGLIPWFKVTEKHEFDRIKRFSTEEDAECWINEQCQALQRIRQGKHDAEVIDKTVVKIREC